MTIRLAFLWPALAGVPLLAQNTVVSPAPASATVEGSQANAFPWIRLVPVSRYMQVHSDVHGAAGVITRLAFRRDGPLLPQRTGTRSVDLEMWMGDSVDWNKISFVFANNYLAPKTTVLPRQIVNIGPTRVAGSPAPFEIAVPINGYTYAGATSLAWECVQYSNTSAGMTNSLDAEAGSSTTGTAPLTGAGCMATGQRSVMDLGIEHVERGGAYQFGAFVRFAPASAPTFVYFGNRNLNLPYPGLCSNVLTDLAFVVPVGNADASGYVGELGPTTSGYYPSALCTFVVPNTLAGATFYAQAHSIDLGRSDPIPLCNSNGRAITVPLPNLARVSKVSRLYNFFPQGPAHPHATPMTLSHGYGVVVEFTN